MLWSLCWSQILHRPSQASISLLKIWGVKLQRSLCDLISLESIASLASVVIELLILYKTFGLAISTLKRYSLHLTLFYCRDAFLNLRKDLMRLRVYSVLGENFSNWQRWTIVGLLILLVWFSLFYKSQSVWDWRHRRCCEWRVWNGVKISLRRVVSIHLDWLWLDFQF